MTYKTTADISDDGRIARRVTAAAATEGIENPDYWTHNHRWGYAAQPGWAAAWDSAVAAGSETPGDDPAVITDGMILAAVQALNVPA
jgi:hypothetical protein